MTADAGEHRGYVLGPEDGDAQWHMGCLFDWKAVGEQTGGLFSIFEATIRKGAEPPVHVHTREDEFFYVLEGEITFKVGEEIVDAPAGSFVYAPRHTPHGFALGTDTARALILIAPAGMEGAFAPFSEPARRRTLGPVPEQPPYDEMEKLDAEYGITYVGPPLAEALAQER